MSDALERYRLKYTHINRTILEDAAQKDPELLVEIIEDKSVGSLSRSLALEELCVYARDEHWDLCLKTLSDEIPFVRESAVISIIQYYDRDEYNSALSPKKEVKQILENRLIVETSAGVIKRLNVCLEWIDNREKSGF